MRKIQQSGKTWFGPTHWRGQFALRFSECSWVTTDEDIEVTLGAIREALEAQSPASPCPSGKRA